MEDVDLSSVKYEPEVIQGVIHSFIPLVCFFCKQNSLQLNFPVSSSNIWIDLFFFAAPHLTGFVFRLFVRILEAPLIGPFLMTILKKENKIDEVRAYVCVCLIVCLFVCFCCWNWYSMFARFYAMYWRFHFSCVVLICG